MQVYTLSHYNVSLQHYLVMQRVDFARQTCPPQPVMDGIEPTDIQLAGQMLLKSSLRDQPIVGQWYEAFSV